MTSTARTSLLALTLAASLAGGCSFTPPERPAYEGTDQVGSDVDPSSLLGTWRVTPLNPYPDQGEQDTVIEYREDGTVSGVTRPLDEQSVALFGEGATFEMNGGWTLVDGSVRHSDMSMEVKSDNPAARLAGSFINGAGRDFSGTADILELDADRIVMLGTDGGAMRYDRIE